MSNTMLGPPVGLKGFNADLVADRISTVAATSGVTFAGLLIGVVIILGGLTYLPALVLGPIAEHFTR